MSVTDETWSALMEAAPELSSAPWLAMPLSETPGDPIQNAQVGAQAANTMVRDKAIQRLKDHHSHGLFGGIIDSVVRFEQKYNPFVTPTQKVTPEQISQEAQAKGLDPNTYAQQEIQAGRLNTSGFATTAVNQTSVTPQSLARSINLPLQEVQHQYRYLRDVQQRHGTAAMLAELGPIAAGAVGGALVGGPQGAVLGGEVVGGVQGRLAFTDSWDATKDQSYRDLSGRPVNVGEDVARVVPKLWGGELRQGTAPYKALADIAGIVSVFALDPVQAGVGLAHSPAGAIGAALPDRVLIHSTDVDRILAQSKTAQKVFEDMATKPGEQIAREYPEFAPLAKDLGRAQTAEGVAQVLKDAFDQAEVVGMSVPRFANPSRPDVLGGLAPTAVEDARIGGLSRAERMARTKVPMILDPETMQLSNTQIDPVHNTPEAFDAVERLAKMGNLTDRAASGIKQAYIDTQSSAARIQILRNLSVRSVLSKLPTDVLSDPRIESEVRGAVTDHMGGVAGGIDDLYGHNTMGLSTSKLSLADDSETAAGIWMNQRGPVALPNYVAVQRWAREEAGPLMKVFGRIDDFAYNRLIVPFKRLALLTGGFALRVGSAEGIPAALRNGFYDTMRASIGAKAAKIGYALEQGETGHITAAMEKLAGGADNLLNSEADRELAAEIAIRTQGQMVTPAINPGHFASIDRIGAQEAETINIYKGAQASPKSYLTDEFMGYGQRHRDFPLYWQQALREASGDEGATYIASTYRDAFLGAMKEGKSLGEATAAATDAAVARDKEFLANLPEQTRSAYLRAQVGEDPIADWAKTRVETFKGLTHTPDFERVRWLNEVQAGAPTTTMPPESSRPMMELVNHMAVGEAPPRSVLDAIAANDRPLQVKGRVEANDLSGNMTERVANWGHAKVLSPIINTLGREHQFFIATKEAYEPYRELVDQGLMDHDTAMGDALLKATRKTLQFIHNPAERTQMAIAVRTVAPFWFAQEQAYRRVGRLIQDDPQAFVRYMRAIMAMRNYTHEVKDRTGVAQVVMPGLGFIDEGFVKAAAALHLPIAGTVPVSMLGNVNSMNTILPFSEDNPLRPNWSPLVTYPAHILMDLDPASREWVTKGIGETAASGSSFNTLIPNTPLRNLVNAIRPDADRSASYQSAMISVIQAQAYQQKKAMDQWVKDGHSPDDPGHPQIVPDAVSTDYKVRQAYISRIKNQTRVMLIAKALVSAGSPLAPSLAIGYPQLSEDYQKAIKAHGIVEGTQLFLEANPDATPYTIAKSFAPQGAPLPPYMAAQHFYDNNRSLFSQYPDAAAYFLPQDSTGKFDSAVYNEQVALGLRERKDATRWVDDFYIAEGNHQFFDVNYPIYQKALAAAPTKQAQTDLRAKWNEFVTTTMAAQNPTWFNYFTSKDRDNERVQALAQIRKMFDSGSAPSGQQSDGIKLLVHSYDVYQQALADGKARQWSADDRAVMNERWKSYLDGLAKEKPELGMVINRLFRGLR